MKLTSKVSRKSQQRKHSVKDTIAHERPARQMSSTMKISLDPVGGEIPTEIVSFLDIANPGLQPQRLPLEKKELVIGRDKDCSLCIPLTSVSRNHAKLVWDGDNHIIEDIGSTNGTFINNIRVTRCILRNHDQIRVGQVLLTFIEEKVASRI